MKRSNVINSLLDFSQERRYLEVGVNRGQTFSEVSANRKVAVDPQFLFDVSEAQAADAVAEFHQITSDEYFSGVSDPADRFDVIFLDGLHTFEQTLRDFCNAVSYVSDDGFIVIDDVVPSSYPASLPEMSTAVSVRAALNPNDADESWMGDVYKLVFFIETFFIQYSFATVHDTTGQLVVWRQRRPLPEHADRTVEAVGRLGFEKTLLGRDVFKLASLPSILDAIRGARVSAQA